MKNHFFTLLYFWLSITTAFSQKENEIPGIKFLVKSNKYHEKKEYEKALLYINKAIKKDSLNSAYYHNRSVIQADMLQLDKAIADETKAVTLEPEESRYNNGLAALYQRRGREEDSSVIAFYYEKALKLDGSSALNYYNRGLFLRKNGKIKEALSDFYQARKLEPSMSEIHYEIATTKAFSLQYQAEAIADFDKAIELNPNVAQYYGARGDCFFRLGDINNAYKDCEKGFAMDPSNKGILLLKANIYEVTGKVKESMELLDQVIAKDPLAWEAYNSRGITKIFRTHQYESGIDDLNKALAIMPKETIMHNNIGLGYAALGKYQEAIAEYDIVIKEMPEFAYAYNNRGYAKTKIKDYDGAFADILQSIKLDPGNCYAFRNRALLYLEMKKTEDACLDLMRAKELKFETFYGSEVQDLINKHCVK